MGALGEIDAESAWSACEQERWSSTALHLRASALSLPPGAMSPGPSTPSTFLVCATTQYVDLSASFAVDDSDIKYYHYFNSSKFMCKKMIRPHKSIFSFSGGIDNCKKACYSGNVTTKIGICSLNNPISPTTLFWNNRSRRANCGLFPTTTVQVQ